MFSGRWAKNGGLISVGGGLSSEVMTSKCSKLVQTMENCCPFVK